LSRSWQDGKNVVRYIPADEVEQLRKDIAGYQRLITLAEQYADDVIRATRRERKKEKQRRREKS
jgi:hypothetical protein